MQTLKKALDKTDCADLAIESGPLLGGLPGRGYLIIGDLPDGSRLSHGHDVAEVAALFEAQGQGLAALSNLFE